VKELEVFEKLNNLEV